MAKKIEGWEYTHEWSGHLEMTLYRDPVGKEDEPDEKAATLVIHDGPHERVYTESEVRAILEHMLDDNFFMYGEAEGRDEKIRHMAKTHGIDLDA